MKYITTLEASENWKISERMTRKYCIQGRIPGAIQKDKTWLIPEDAQKPSRVAVPDEPEPLPPLALKLIRQKKKKNYHGICSAGPDLPPPAGIPSHRRVRWKQCRRESVHESRTRD